MTHILHIDASSRRAGSVSRELSAKIVSHLSGAPEATVTRRDLAEPLPLIDETWIDANFTAPDERSPAQTERLALSDQLVAELAAADTIVIGMPVYNFSVPAALKLWIDLVARAGVTFRYTAEGPMGLLEDKRVIVAFASGGTEMGSPIDFASSYLRHVLGFLGITEVEFIPADRLGGDADAALTRANARIEALAA